jgi:hypothetical protein
VEKLGMGITLPRPEIIVPTLKNIRSGLRFKAIRCNSS